MKKEIRLKIKQLEKEIEELEVQNQTFTDNEEFSEEEFVNDSLILGLKEEIKILKERGG